MRWSTADRTFTLEDTTEFMGLGPRNTSSSLSTTALSGRRRTVVVVAGDGVKNSSRRTW
jgi:hypothetical protein